MAWLSCDSARGRSSAARRLREAGIHVLGYVSRDGYLVSLPVPPTAGQIKVLTDCDLAAAIRPEWKVEPALSALDASAIVSQVPLIIHATEVTDPLRSAIVAAGGVVTGEVTRARAARLGVLVAPALLGNFLKSVSARK